MQWPGVFLYILFGDWDSWTAESCAAELQATTAPWTVEATAAELRRTIATSQASSSWQPEQAWTADATAAELRRTIASSHASSSWQPEQASAPYSLAPDPPSFPPPGFPVLSPLLPLAVLPPQLPKLAPKAPAGLLPSSLEGVAPPSASTPPPDVGMAAKAVPKPPPGDPLVALVQGQADVPLVINR